MRICLSLLGLTCLLAACTQVRTTRITDVTDLPLKTTEVPDWSWEKSPLRANARYAMFRAHTATQKQARLGDYYYLDWYDAEPDKPVRVVMSYTQAATGSRVLTRTVEYAQPRPKPGKRSDHFFFDGEDRAKGGDIMTWRMDLYCDGRPVDHRQSYLWQ